jgi:hypothetical protein
MYTSRHFVDMLNEPAQLEFLETILRRLNRARSNLVVGFPMPTIGIARVSSQASRQLN